MAMYLLSYEYDGDSRNESFNELEVEAANNRYKELKEDRYVSHLETWVMSVGVSFYNKPNATIYKYLTENNLGKWKAVAPVDKEGNRLLDKYGEPVSVYIHEAGYIPSADAKKLAKKLNMQKLKVLHIDENNSIMQVS